MFQNRLGLALWLEGNLPFLLCFTLYLRAISKYISPQGAYIWRGDLTEGFLRYEFRGLIFGVAYTWRDLFSEFYGIFGTTVMSSRTNTSHKFCVTTISSPELSNQILAVQKSLCNCEVHVTTLPKE